MPARRRMARPGRAAACAKRCAHCWPGGSAPRRPAGRAGRSGRCCSWRWPPVVTAGPHRTVSRSPIGARKPRAASAIIFACTGRAAGRRQAPDPLGRRFSYQGRPGLLCTTGRKSPALPLAAGLWRTGARASMPTRWRGRGAGLYGGRYIMARSGLFYVVKAMERTVAGADAPRAPARQPADRELTAGARAYGRSSLARRMVAAVQRSLGGAPGPAGRGRHRVGGAARAD